MQFWVSLEMIYERLIQTIFFIYYSYWSLTCISLGEISTWKWTDKCLEGMSWVRVWMPLRWQNRQWIRDGCFPASLTALHSILYLLFHHYLSNYHFLPLLDFLEKKFFEFCQIPRNIRSVASNKCFLFRELDTLPICVFFFFPFNFPIYWCATCIIVCGVCYTVVFIGTFKHFAA